ncbi:MAG TPA: hypothetical protein VFS05_14855 [Gemmatimonadaceae bacterium]|nr:hypothetical protein [Gemmatimonadaceae bacterium]
MHTELVESLCCVREHELTWLVARTDERAGRHIIRGVLGCPTCGAEYPIERGVADFTLGRAPVPVPAADGRAAESVEEGMLAAALLDLTSPGGFVALAGAWARAAAPLRELVDGVHVLVLDAPDAPDALAGDDGVSMVRTAGEIPIRPQACRGIALDAAHATPRALAQAAAALRARGRLIAPADAAMPTPLAELARDVRRWVGERPPDSAVVRISRARRDA